MRNNNSLISGVVAYEMLRGQRPFDIHSNTSIEDVRLIFHQGVEYKSSWSVEIVDLLSKVNCKKIVFFCTHYVFTLFRLQLLAPSPGARVSSLQELKKIKCLQKIDMDMVYRREYKPFYCPPVRKPAAGPNRNNVDLRHLNRFQKDHLNCDPTFELEEMIIETRPLHKKKKRLAKQRSIREIQGPLNMEMVNSRLLSHCALLIRTLSGFRLSARYRVVNYSGIQNLQSLSGARETRTGTQGNGLGAGIAVGNEIIGAPREGK